MLKKKLPDASGPALIPIILTSNKIDSIQDFPLVIFILKC